MDQTVLVTYASKYGATREIADKIGESIVNAGVQAEVLPVDEVADLGKYSAAVLGSAVYIGHWRKEAVRFVKKHETELAKMPVWIFSSGPTEDADTDAFMDGGRLPKAVAPVAEHIHPRDTVIFHGAIDSEQMSSFESWLLKRVKAPISDAREWEEIAAWGAGIAEAVRATNG